MSVPAPPSIVSEPSPPVMVLAVEVPVNVSLKDEPVIFSMLVRMSPAAVPPVLIFVVRFTVTASVESE